MINNKNRVMLVNAPCKQTVEASGNAACFPPLNLASLATAVKNAHAAIKPEIMIADGGIYSTDDIKRKIDEFKPGIIGIGIMTPTYREGRAIAEYAHQAGAKVVFGNDHASILAEQIMENCSYADYVVKAEFGEIPFSYIVGAENSVHASDLPIASVKERNAKVFFRAAGGISSMEFPEQRLLQMPDFGLIPDEDMGRYAKNYNDRYYRFHKKERKPGLINNANGCSNNNHPCIYCGIYDLKVRTGTAGHFWKMVAGSNERYGTDFFMEVYDNFLSSPRYVKALLEEMGKSGIKLFDRDIEFEVYARADGILTNKESVRWLKKMNVTRVNLGVDSGDDDILVALGKNMDKRLGMRPSEINFRAIEKLANAGITFHMSFVLGSLGETQGSLDNTVEFVRAVAKMFPSSMAMVEASELVPLPNSPSWKLMHGNAQSEDDEPDMHEAITQWLKRFTSVSMGMIGDAKERIGKIAGKCGIAGNSFFD
jgi:radical SAM superfamily enzyme YgiQ (UPF0313 family)